MAKYKDIVGTAIRNNAGNIPTAETGQVFFDSTNVDFNAQFDEMTTKAKFSPCAVALKKLAWRLRGFEGLLRLRRLWHRFATHVRSSAVVDVPDVPESKEEEPSDGSEPSGLAFSTPPPVKGRRSAGSSIRQYRPIPREHLAPGSPDIKFCSQDGSVFYTNLQKASDEWIIDHESELRAAGLTTVVDERAQHRKLRARKPT